MPVQGTLRVGKLRRVVRTVHLHVLQTLLVLILVGLRIELYHGELLLQRAVAHLFGHQALLLHVLESALVVLSLVHHLAEVLTVLFCLSLVARRLILQRHRPIAAIHVILPVDVSNHVSVDKDELRCVRLLETLRELLLASARMLPIKAGHALTSAHWRVCHVGLLLVFKTA